MLLDERHGGEEKIKKLAMRALEAPQHLRIDASVTDDDFSERLQQLMDTFAKRLELVETDQDASMKAIKKILKRADERASRVRGNQLNLLDRSALQDQISTLTVKQLGVQDVHAEFESLR